MIYNRIKFRHLQCFLEVARQRSVGRAADSLSLSQPAVSKKLKELEEMLGVRLMERNKNGVTMTGFGEVFLKYAGASVNALREGADSISQARMKSKTSLTIGILPTVAASILPMAVERFRKLGMDVTLKLISAPNNFLLGQLRVGDLDLVVGRLAEPAHMSGLSFQHLYSESLVFAVRKGHPLLKKERLSFMDIRDYTVLFPVEGSIIAKVAKSVLVAEGVGELPDVIEVISGAFGKEYVRQTDAIWIISHGVAAPQIGLGVLEALPLGTEDTLGPVGLTTRADTIPSPTMQLFMHAVRDEAEAQKPGFGR
jgi:LysR family pca operon transcriptional activator